MLPEMYYVQQELLPMLRERAGDYRARAQKQLRQWRHEKGVVSVLLSLDHVPQQDLLPKYDLKEIHDDPEKMFISQLRSALCTAFAQGDAVPSVRANVGCGAFCTMLGGLEQTYFPDKMPWLLQHLTLDQLKSYTSADIVLSDQMRRGLEQMRYMKQMLEGTGIEVFPMDLQGPIDMAHLLLGNEFFYAFYDDPDAMHHVLSLCVQMDCLGMEKCLEIIAPESYVAHYNGLVLPKDHPLKISEDSSTLICQEHLEEFMRPYTTALFERFGGGYIHYCGDNAHLLKIAVELEPKLAIGLNFGNPERHDMPQVLRMLAQYGKCFYGRNQLPVDQAVQAGICPDGSNNHFIVRTCSADSQQEILETVQREMENGECNW